MTVESTGGKPLPVKGIVTSPREQLESFMKDVRETYRGYKELGDLRDAQQPFMRLYRDVLLGELRTTGIVHIAEDEANCVLECDITYFQPGKKTLSSTTIYGSPIDLTKPHWDFMLDDVEYDADDVEEMGWQEGLHFGFGRTLKEHTPTEPGVWATTSMLYLPNRHLVINGAEVTYETTLGFFVARNKHGLNFSAYDTSLIQPPENFDSEAFRQGLRRSFENPRKHLTGEVAHTMDDESKAAFLATLDLK